MRRTLTLFRLWWLWRQWPTLRLGQLMSVASRAHEGQFCREDLFYVKDQDLTRWIDHRMFLAKTKGVRYLPLDPETCQLTTEKRSDPC